jgi:hypothetical protein
VGSYANGSGFEVNANGRLACVYVHRRFEG